jgi:hypothetical protein
MYIKSQPYYDYKSNCYFSILTLNKKPINNVLKDHVVRIQNPKLSPFEEFSQCSSREQCLYVIKKTLLEKEEGYTSKNCIEYLTFDDYPFLLDFLIDSGITVNTDISNMLQNHISHVPLNILCYISN